MDNTIPAVRKRAGGRPSELSDFFKRHRVDAENGIVLCSLCPYSIGMPLSSFYAHMRNNHSDEIAMFLTTTSPAAGKERNGVA
jgi:hypothetical protein